MWSTFNHRLGGEASKGHMANGLPVTVACGALRGGEFEAVTSADSGTMLRYFLEPDPRPFDLSARLSDDPRVRDAYRCAFGSALLPQNMEVGATVTFFGGEVVSEDGAADLLEVVDAIAGSADPSPPLCWHCRTEPADVTWRDGALTRQCTSCKELGQGWTERYEALADAAPPTTIGEVFPPLPLPVDLTPERLSAMADDHDAAYAANPGLYRWRLMAWMALGQLAMVGAAILLIAVVLGAVGMFGGLAYAGAGLLFIKLLASGKVLKVLLAALVGAGVLLSRFASSITGVFRSGNFSLDELPGETLSRDDAPGLYAWLDQLADEVEAPRVDRVLVDGQLNAFATERRVGRFRHERIVGIGLPLMQILEEDEFSAVMAHELGHLRNQDARAHWIYRAAHDWTELGWKLAEEDMGAHRFARWYVPRFLIRTRALRREHERAADRAAAKATSPEAMMRALVKIQVASQCMDDALDASTGARADDGHIGPVPFGHLLLEGMAALPAQSLVQARNTALDEEPHWLDTHPPLRERCAVVGVPPLSEVHFELSRPATGLLPDLDQIRERLLARQQAHIAIGLERTAHTRAALRARLSFLQERAATEAPDAGREMALSGLLGSLGRHEEAVVHARRASDLLPERPEVLSHLVKRMLDAHQLDEASQTATSMLVLYELGLPALFTARHAFELAGARSEETAVINRIRTNDLPDEIHQFLDVRQRAIAA